MSYVKHKDSGVFSGIAIRFNGRREAIIISLVIYRTDQMVKIFSFRFDRTRSKEFHSQVLETSALCDLEYL